MAARRLLIVMLILLGLSTLAASQIPPRESSDDAATDTTETTASVPTETEPAGEEVPFAVPIRKRVSVVQVDAGDQLALAICSNQPDQVEIPAFGLLEAVGPAEAATFQLLVEEPGTYGVRLVNADRVAVRIQVAEAGPEESEAAPARKITGRQRQCAELAGLPTGG
jgi:hypothetical protein